MLFKNGKQSSFLKLEIFKQKARNIINNMTKMKTISSQYEQSTADYIEGTGIIQI